MRLGLHIYQRVFNPLLSSMKRRGSIFFCDRYLLYTNTGISAGLSMLGDGLQQSYQQLKKQRSMNCDHIAWNHKRTAQMACSGLVIGPFVHYWYIYLEKWFPGRGLKTLVKKVLVDQIVCSPVYIGLFLISIGILDGQNWSSIENEFKNKGVTMYIAEFLVWPPAQFFNFYLLPLKFRVLFDSAVSLVMDTYFSYLRFDLDSKSKVGEKAFHPVNNGTDFVQFTLPSSEKCADDMEHREVCENCRLSNSNAQSNFNLKSEENDVVLGSHVGLFELKNSVTKSASISKCQEVKQSVNEEDKAVNIFLDQLEVHNAPQSTEEEGGFRSNAHFFSLMFSWS